jgi:O-acetyl-ADP-ribose deacetylase (regulator of RNase III)
MYLILCDISKPLCIHWQHYFHAEPDVSIINSPFEEVASYQAIVSPANSFGLMDGGFDQALIDYFGTELMYKVQQYIINNYFGEQPVGTAFAMHTDNPTHPYLIHAPTMRVSMNISQTDNVYNAMRAIISTAINSNFDSVLCPGLGTLTGQVPYEQAAKQMYLGYKSIINSIKEINWETAINVQKGLIY